MRQLAFCICKNKDADHLGGNREADQHLCFRYMDSTIPLFPKSKISSLQSYSVVVQPGFVWDLVGNPENWFSRNVAQFSYEQAHMSLVLEPVFRVSDQVWHKPG